MSIIIGAGIIYLSHQPYLTVPGPVSVSDSILHIIEYLVFGSVVLYAWSDKVPFPYLVIGLLLYAVSDELHQSYIPGRDCSVLDWIADFTGVLIGWVLVKFTDRRLQKGV